MPPILPPRDDDKIFKKQVRQALAATPGQDENPIVYPARIATLAIPIATITSGTFVDTWTTELQGLQHRGLKVGFVVTTDAGTTAEVRFHINRPTLDDNYSAVIPVAAAANVRLNYAWAHPLDVPYYDVVILGIQARRVSGSGNVNVLQPAGGFLMTHVRGCTPTGV